MVKVFLDGQTYTFDSLGCATQWMASVNDGCAVGIRDYAPVDRGRNPLNAMGVLATDDPWAQM
jgi:hypothetical protein